MLSVSNPISPRDRYELQHGPGSWDVATFPEAVLEGQRLLADDRLAGWHSLGWSELENSTADSLWDKLWTDQGRLLEPVPSVTWDIGDAFSQDQSKLNAAEVDLTIKTLANFKACARRGKCLYALDWQHPCFLFDPHGGAQKADAESWAVSVFPDGDTLCFIEPEFRFGTLGHVDKTFCVFGSELLAAFERNKPAILRSVIRRNGKDI